MSNPAGITNRADDSVVGSYQLQKQINAVHHDIFIQKYDYPFNNISLFDLMFITAKKKYSLSPFN
jgi:hypothetical protein